MFDLGTFFFFYYQNYNFKLKLLNKKVQIFVKKKDIVNQIWKI